MIATGNRRQLIHDFILVVLPYILFYLCSLSCYDSANVMNMSCNLILLCYNLTSNKIWAKDLLVVSYKSYVWPVHKELCILLEKSSYG